MTKVTTIRVVVGQRLRALPGALRFAFEVLTGEEVLTEENDSPESVEPGTGLFRGAVLEIEDRPTKARCRACGLEYSEHDDKDWCTEEGEWSSGNPGDAEGKDPGRWARTGCASSGLGWALPCPRCGALAPEILSGEEFLVDYYEGE